MYDLILSNGMKVSGFRPNVQGIDLGVEWISGVNKRGEKLTIRAKDISVVKDRNDSSTEEAG